MGKFSFGGCMQGMKRANSKDLAGWVEGSITHLKSGKHVQEKYTRSIFHTNKDTAHTDGIFFVNTCQRKAPTQ